jgi:electron transfer flavoprotein alpha subunit
MEKIGILIDIKDGELKKTNFGVITLARGDARELYAFVFNGKAEEYKTQLQQYGIAKIINITSPDGQIEWNPAVWAGAVIAAMKAHDITTLCGLTSAQGKDVLPRIAAALDAPLVMDCLDIDLNAHTAEKSQYSGKTIATVKLKGKHFLYGIRPNASQAASAPCEAEIIHFQVSLDCQDLVATEVKHQAASGVDLTEADVIISGGRGMREPENFKILFECADAIGAAVGASRVAVDAGWVPHTMQVGQTGATVSPKVYIACGISGSIQHFAGMKTSGMIVAINTDPEANIAQNCDYHIGADLFEIIPLLTQALKAVVSENDSTGETE